MTDLLSGIKFKGKPIAVITSDWHMALGAWKKLPDIKGDAEFSLSQIVDISLGLGVPLVAAGDLFDIKHPDSYSVNVVSQQMAKLSGAKLPCFYVQGQHEMASPTWLSLFPNCKHVHDQHFKLGSVECFGYDYFLPNSIEDSYNRLKPADVLVTHQVWSELLPHTGQEFCCSYELVLDKIGYKSIISGDFHSHFITKCEKAATFVSPGSICLQDLKESCNKAAWVLTDSLEFVSVPYKSRRLIQCTVASESDLHTIVKIADGVVSDDLPNGIGKPIYRIRYSTALDNVNAAVTSAFKGKAHIDLVPIIEDSLEALTPDSSVFDPVTGVVDINASFHESLKDFCDTSHRSYNDLIRLWSARSVDDIRRALEDITSEIKNNGLRL
jgi:DNA repair exonuclease SbcCD nuclease subunit